MTWILIALNLKPYGVLSLSFMVVVVVVVLLLLLLVLVHFFGSFINAKDKRSTIIEHSDCNSRVVLLLMRSNQAHRRAIAFFCFEWCAYHGWWIAVNWEYQSEHVGVMKYVFGFVESTLWKLFQFFLLRFIVIIHRWQGDVSLLISLAYFARRIWIDHIRRYPNYFLLTHSTLFWMLLST